MTDADDPRERLGWRLGELARDLQRLDRQEDVLTRVVQAAVEIVPGAEHASISLVRRRRDVRSAAATDDVGRSLDETQQRLGQGPCMDAAYEHVTVRVRDLSREQRWPQLAEHASELGIASVLCLQLYVHGDDLGALNLCAASVDAFDDEAEQVGLSFAAHAAVALASTRKLTGMSSALASRDLIGQAKGVLMATYRVDADTAFAMLSRLSQDTNRKLVDVAEAVTATGELRARLDSSVGEHAGGHGPRAR